MTEPNNEAMLKSAFEAYVDSAFGDVPTDEPDSAELSDRFKKRIKKLINRQKAVYFRLINTAVKRAACFVLVAALALSAITASSKNIREDFTHYFSETVTKYVKRIYKRESPSSGPELVANLPKYIPEGFVESSVYMEKQMLSYYYSSEDNKDYIAFHQSVLSPGGIISASINSKIEEVKVGKYNGIIIDCTYYRDLSFVTNDYEYFITTTLSKEELLKIGISVLNDSEK